MVSKAGNPEDLENTISALAEDTPIDSSDESLESSSDLGALSGKIPIGSSDESLESSSDMGELLNTAFEPAFAAAPLDFPAVTQPNIADLFEFTEKDGVMIIGLKNNAIVNDQILKVFLESPNMGITRVPCNSAGSLIQNLIYLALKTVKANAPKDWIEGKIIDDLEDSKEIMPDEVKPELKRLTGAVEDYDEMADGIVRKAEHILAKINKLIISDCDTINLVSKYLAHFQDDKNLVEGCGIIDPIEDSINKFIQPIFKAVDEFNAAMTNNRLDEIRSTIIEITNINKGKPGDEANKPMISEIKQKIVNFINLLKQETAETPSRFDSARAILDKCVAEHTKPVQNSSNPNEKS